jgi:hypothetical protein
LVQLARQAQRVLIAQLRDQLEQLVQLVLLELTVRSRAQSGLQVQRVLLVRKVSKVLVFRFLVLTTQLKNLKQLSRQEPQVMGT